MRVLRPSGGSSAVQFDVRHVSISVPRARLLAAQVNDDRERETTIVYYTFFYLFKVHSTDYIILVYYTLPTIHMITVIANFICRIWA